MTRHIVLVGARKGIGAALLQQLLLDPEVHVWHFSREPLEFSDSRITDQRWDASSDEDNAPLDLPEQIAGLVYCPGTIQLAPFARLKPAQFLHDLQVNLLGAVRILQACQKGLHNSEHASIVLFSTVAVQLGMPMHASIASAKGAVEALVRALAAEWAPKVRVNAIAPSLTQTPLAAPLLKTERQQQAAAERHPLGRVGQTQDHAALAAFLLSTDASWITGQVIGVDGGLGHLMRNNA
jgi:NAD(P)-dependent dehydrogenase (short-subunit alcohol dehydrogenase family)